MAAAVGSCRMPSTSSPAIVPALRVASICGASKYAGTVMTARATRTSMPAGACPASCSCMRARSSARIFADTSSGESGSGPCSITIRCPIRRFTDSIGAGVFPRRARAGWPTRYAFALGSQATAEGTVLRPKRSA